MVLVDSSAWIATTRRGGDENLRERVNALIRTRQAAWCPAVRLELWPGAKGRMEISKADGIEGSDPRPGDDAAGWERAIDLAGRVCKAGFSCPYPDLLIAACATVRGAELLHCDKHFDRLAIL